MENSGHFEHSTNRSSRTLCEEYIYSEIERRFQVVPRSVPFVLPHTSSGRDPPIRLCFSSWRAKRWAISCQHICATSLFICSYVTRFVRVVEGNFFKIESTMSFSASMNHMALFLGFSNELRVISFFFLFQSKNYFFQLSFRPVSPLA